MKYWCSLYLCSCCDVFKRRVCALYMVLKMVNGAILPRWRWTHLLDGVLKFDAVLREVCA